MKGQFEKLQSSYEQAQQRQNEDQDEFMLAVSSSQKSLEEARLAIERLSREKVSALQEVLELKSQLERSKLDSQVLQDEVVLVKASLKNLESYQAIIKSLEKEKQDLVGVLFSKKKDYIE